MPDSIELLLGAPDGNEPDRVHAGTIAPDHECIFVIERSGMDRAPRYEKCLVCKQRRRLVPKDADSVFVPAPLNVRTGY